MTSPPDELAFLEQALRYLDGTLDAATTEAFHRTLAADPAAARKLAALTMQRVQLQEMGPGAAVLRAIPRRSRRWAPIAFSMAAAAAIAVTAVVLLRPRGERPEHGPVVVAPPVAPPLPALPPATPPSPAGIPARIEAVQGDVAVVADQGRAPAKVGRLLVRDEALTVGAGHATVRINDGGIDDGRLEIGAHTTIEPQSPRAIAVTRGFVHVDWKSGTLALNTPLGELRASGGARFRLEIRGDDTRVELHRGALRVTAFANGHVVDLEPGTLATLAPEKDLQLERQEPPLAVVFDLQANPRELALFRRMPARLLPLLRGWTMDKEGFLGPNRAGFKCAGEQRHALNGMMVGAALGNRSYIEDAWRTIDATIRFQADDGSFLDSVVCDADWLGEVSHALTVLLQSDWERSYRARVKALMPKLGRTAAYLSTPERLEELRTYGAGLSKGYFLQAAAFAFTGLLLGDASLQATGRAHLELGLQLQRQDGAFQVHDGVDSAYQGYILQHLGWFAQTFPEPRYEAAMRAGGAWLMTRITAAGELDVRDNTRTGPGCRPENCIGVDWQRVPLGLMYYGLDHDPRAVDAAAKLRERQRTVSR